MSDTTTPRLKVSREGVVLIKSFEGFRPHAVRAVDGRWVIGYGHTASAREGLSVGEQDAELLLQYDLLPVVRALNDRASASLNQHQFDALASFALSVGVERFLASDVLQRLDEGEPGRAADALFGWPETPAAEAGLRRRVAERALFVAAPGAAVTVADLLISPLPSPGEPFVTRPAATRPPSVPAAQAVPPSRYAPFAAAVDGPLPGFEPSAPGPETVDPRPVVPLVPPAPSPSPFPDLATPLVLTPLTDADMVATERQASAEETRDTATAGPGEATLFGEEPAPSVLRHEAEPSRPAGFDWSQTGAFLVMGGVGLLACAFSAAAFRLAVFRPSPMGETVVVGWALALIGVICVGVSSWNLYVRWGKPD